MNGRPLQRVTVSSLVVSTLWLLSASAEASPQDLFGYGGRTPGMAMTGTAYATGYEAVFANPAGLGASRTKALSLGIQGGGYQLSIDGQGSPLTPARGIVIGFQLPLPFEDVLEDRLVFGGAFYTPAEVLLRGNVRFPEVPQWNVLERAQVLALMIGLAFDFHDIVDGLQIGVGFGALANVFGALDVRLDETNSFVSTVETQLLTAFAPYAGVRYARDEWGIGLAYRHETSSRMDLNIVTADLPLDLPVLTVGGVVQYDPSTILAEGYWRPIPDLMLVLNLTTRLWNLYPGTSIPTTSASIQAPAPDFSVIPSPRVAIEGRLVNDPNYTIELRGGYAYEATPAPPARIAQRRTADGMPLSGDTVPFRLLDNDRHIVTLGLGWTLHLGEHGEAIVLDAYGQLHALAPRTHEIGRTDTGAPMVTDGYILVGGWTMRAEF